MSFNKEEYLKRFTTLISLIQERNLLHAKYYFDADQAFTREEKCLARDKLRSLTEKFHQLIPLDSVEWLNAWGKCPCGKGTL